MFIKAAVNQRLMPLLIVCTFAAASAAQTLTVSPTTFSQRDEAFLDVTLSSLAATDYALVTFTGPGGTVTLEPQHIADGYLNVWVPELVMNNTGTYAVYVDATRSGTTTRYGPAHITVNAPPPPAPALSLPEVVSAEATSAAGAVVTFAVTSTDGTAVTCSPPSGSTFRLGPTTVSCSSASGITGSFNVFVQDTVPPILTVPADITTRNQVVTYSVTARDAIDPAPTVECHPASGSTFPYGTSVVDCNAVDHHANSVVGTFRVTVSTGSPVVISNIAVSEPFFSPNGDGTKDATTFSATATASETHWTVTVSSASGTPLLTSTRTGTALSFTWDGRDSNGVVQPDGPYTFAVSAVDGQYSANATASTVVDRTIPTASIAAPSSGQVYSNIRQTGPASTTIVGTTTDANLLSWDVSAGLNSGSSNNIGSGTIAVSNGALGTWSTGSLSNGEYIVRLRVQDRAGNVATATATLTVAHFSATQSAYQVNTAAGGTVTYTSVVPFTATQTLTIRNGAGVIVRTLVNGTRSAGTYADTWNGRNDAGLLLPDGPYSYVATVSEGGHVLSWDLSTQMRGGTETQFPYPSCSARTMPLNTCSNNAAAGHKYDVFANDPLKIHYTVDEPSRVTIVFTSLAETPGNCTSGEICVINGEYRPTGSYVEAWPGVFSNGAYARVPEKLTVVRRTNTFPKNVVLLHGSGSPTEVKNLLLTPPVFGPEGGGMKIEFDLATFGNTPANVTFEISRQGNLSKLATIALTSIAPGRVTHTWTGKADSGHWVAPGEYSLIVTSTANGGSSAMRSRFVVVY